MTDRELLELAAKAAGIVVHGLADKYVAQHDYGADGLCVANDSGGDSLWNPLTDDGDALRLAVRLNLAIHPLPGGALAVEVSYGYMCAREAYGDSRYAATRRAIVRAAAAIGIGLTTNTCRLK